MAVVTMKRCKGCIAWRRDPKFSGQGTSPRRKNMCHMRLTDEVDEASGEKREVKTFNTDPETTRPSKFYGRHTDPAISCPHHTAKHKPVTKPSKVLDVVTIDETLGYRAAKAVEESLTILTESPDLGHSAPHADTD